jgi:cation transport ATPase
MQQAIDSRSPELACQLAGHTSWRALMTPARWLEVARIVFTGSMALLFWSHLIPVQALWVAVAIGLYPLTKTAVVDLIHERKIGTEVFVTVATLVALTGGETAAGAAAQAYYALLVDAHLVWDMDHE